MVFGPPICRGDATDFGHAFSNSSYFRARGRFWLSSVQRAPRLGGEKRKKKKELENVAIIAMYDINVDWLHYFHLVRPPDIHVGGLIYFTTDSFFLSSFFFRPLISEVAERNSTKIGHVLGSNSVSYTHLTLPTNREV